MIAVASPLAVSDKDSAPSLFFHGIETKPFISAFRTVSENREPRAPFPPSWRVPFLSLPPLLLQAEEEDEEELRKTLAAGGVNREECEKEDDEEEDDDPEDK